MSLLIHDAPSANADLLYLGQFDAPDPFTALVINGQKIALLNRLEFSRAQKTSAFDQVLSLENWMQKSQKLHPRTHKQNPLAATIATVAAHHKTRDFTIPRNFPADLYLALIKHKLSLAISPELFPERQIKTPRQAAAIREGNRAAAAGIAAAETLLRKSKIKSGKLYLDGKPLTSEKLKTAIEIACLENGALSIGTIAAGGDQACDPHETGHGQLRANQLIVIDVFPRVTKTGYHGDMTRTFLKGRPTDAQRHLVATVRNAQLAALAALRPGVNGREIHQIVCHHFAKHGYKTTHTAAGSTGFFHGTGHGLGLEIHEAPRVSTADNILRQNTVVTIEPGLYYPGLGACRIEDVARLTAKKPALLSSYHYDWILP